MLIFKFPDYIMRRQQRYLAAIALCVLFSSGLGFAPPYISSRPPLRCGVIINKLHVHSDQWRSREVYRGDEQEENETAVDTAFEMQSNNNNNNNFAPPPNEDPLLVDERTLYEILGASSDATRDELKKQYVKLARQTHPDAMVGKSPEEREEKELVFTEVAAAWRILSDKRERVRYDRSLVAKEFTRNIEQVAGEYADKVARTAAPAVSRVLESLFRTRTGSDDTESFNAAAEQVREARAQQIRIQEERARKEKEQRVKAAQARAERARAEEEARPVHANGRANGQNVNVGSMVASAVKQGKKVTRVIDRYELLKKSRELEQISMEEIERSMAIKGELANVMNKRLSLSLRTPNSALTSAEALKLLDGLNTIDSFSLMEAIRLKQPLITDINCLEDVECEYDDKFRDQSKAQQQLTEMKEALWKADLKAQEAVEAEKEARRVLEEAQRQVIATRRDLMDWNRMYSSAEVKHRKTTQDMEKVSLALSRKQERVRTALRRKEEEVLEVRVTDDMESLDTLGLSDLERLRMEEGYLRAESARLDDRAKRLRSRARKLKRRCEELKVEEEGGDI